MNLSRITNMEALGRLINRIETNDRIVRSEKFAHLVWHLDGATDDDVQDLLERSDLSLWLSGRDGLEDDGFRSHTSRMERLGKEI